VAPSFIRLCRSNGRLMAALLGASARSTPAEVYLAATEHTGQLDLLADDIAEQ